MKWNTMACALMLMISGSLSRAWAKSPPALCPLTNQDLMGAGCSLDDPETKKIFLWREEESSAQLCINHADVTAKLVRTTEPKGDLKKGDRFSQSYLWKDIVVLIDYQVTRVCEKGDESCESWDTVATVRVRKGEFLSEPKKLIGSCGS